VIIKLKSRKPLIEKLSSVNSQGKQKKTKIKKKEETVSEKIKAITHLIFRTNQFPTHYQNDKGA